MILHGGGGDTEAACWYLRLLPGWCLLESRAWESQDPQVEARRNKTGKKGMTARAVFVRAPRLGTARV